MLKKAILLFLILCMLIIMVSCGGNPIIPPVDEEGNIHITDMFWDSDMKAIEITLDPFPSTCDNWTMYINGEKLSMEGGPGNPVIRPNASLYESPTGLFVGTLPWLGPLTEVDFPCCGTIQFDIPGEGLTNEYEFNLINFGCETASEEECSQTPIPSPDPEEEAIIPDTTKIIDEETKEQVVEVTSDQSVIIFAQSTPQLEELKVGDIIVMGVTDQTPYGLLRKVTGIDKGTTKYSPLSFYLGFGTLEEAIQKGHWEYSQTLKPEDIEKGFVFSEGIQLAREKISTSLDFGYPINEILYDQDNDPATTENNITATGYLAFDYQIIFDGEIDGHTLKYFIFENIIETDSELNISVGASVSIADLGDVADVTIGKPIPFTPVTVYIPTPIPFVFIPLVFCPSIELKVGIEGKATIKLEAGITQTTKYTAGIEFTEGNWKNITNPLPEIDHTMELADPEGTIHVTAHAGPQLNCKLYNMAGPYCNIFGYLDFDADISSNPWWDLDAMLTVTAGVKMDVLSFHWDSGERPLFDFLPRFDVADAGGPFGGGTNHPPAISDLSADPASVDINQTTTITCTASDPDGDTLTYYWTKTGGTFEGSTTSSSITWRAPSTEGNYTVECEVSDGEGGEGSESVNIIVTESENPENGSNDEIIFDISCNPIEIYSNFKVSCNPRNQLSDDLTWTWEIPYLWNESITYNEIDYIWGNVLGYACTFTIYCTIDDGINEYSGSLEVEVVNTHEDDTEEIISVIQEFQLAMNNLNWEKAKSCCVYESSLYDWVLSWEHYYYPELHLITDFDVDLINVENINWIFYDPMFFYDDGLEALVIFTVGGTNDGESITAYDAKKINNTWKIDV